MKVREEVRVKVEGGGEDSGLGLGLVLGCKSVQWLGLGLKKASLHVEGVC